MRDRITPISITLALVITACLFVNSLYYCEYTTETYTITDILQVSAGSFTEPTRCILLTDKGKMSMSGNNCNHQIGQNFSITKGSNDFCITTFGMLP